ncbi:MAG: GNAT family N-acetyltransferase [Natronospirillum sp.]|uniref:GNAT family N-acetyltransferase n=1 Tax=Natronospirillum sp. TaxID=2812955 RepID=UPI0025F88019|nr:GNAT family N-acetyltransferase [Natronospirillum sp.]MCH8552283.1 GNAT family N-acetyltransferase [Natronospirillum sp.]
MDIRPARIEDARAIHQVMATIIAEGRYLMSGKPPDLEQYCAHLGATLKLGSPVWVACSDGRVIGWCDVHPRVNPEQQHVGRLGMGVARAWRRRGCGDALLQAAIRKAWRVGFQRLELEVFADNEEAQRLYRRHGFREEGRHIAVRREADGFRDTLTMALVHLSG